WDARIRDRAGGAPRTPGAGGGRSRRVGGAGGGRRAVRTERTGRRWLALATVVLGLLVVQVAGLAHVPIFGVRPELLLVFVLGVALQWGAGPGLAWGGVAGFLAGLFGGYLVGLSAVSYAAAGCAAGFIGVRLYPGRGLVVRAIVAGGTVVSQVVYVAGASAFG